MQKGFVNTTLWGASPKPSAGVPFFELAEAIRHLAAPRGEALGRRLRDVHLVRRTGRHTSARLALLDAEALCPAIAARRGPRSRPDAIGPPDTAAPRSRWSSPSPAAGAGRGGAAAAPVVARSEPNSKRWRKSTRPSTGGRDPRKTSHAAHPTRSGGPVRSPAGAARRGARRPRADVSCAASVGRP